MVTLFLGGIPSVWGLGLWQHWVGVNLKVFIVLKWEHWECPGMALKSVLGVLGMPWEPSVGALEALASVLGCALELHSEPQDPHWRLYWEHCEYPWGSHGGSCSLRLALSWEHWGSCQDLGWTVGHSGVVLRALGLYWGPAWRAMAQTSIALGVLGRCWKHCAYAGTVAAQMGLCQKTCGAGQHCTGRTGPTLGWLWVCPHCWFLAHFTILLW